MITWDHFSRRRRLQYWFLVSSEQHLHISFESVFNYLFQWSSWFFYDSRRNEEQENSTALLQDATWIIGHNYCLFSQSSRCSAFPLFLSVKSQVRWMMPRIIEKNNSLSTRQKVDNCMVKSLVCFAFFHAMPFIFSAGFALWLYFMLFLPQASEPSLEWRKLFRWTHKSKEG